MTLRRSAVCFACVFACASDPDPTPQRTADAGDADAGDADAGAADAGAADAGDADADLSAIDPACAGRQGGEACWREWLKETARPAFDPVPRGGLGAGPWPSAGTTSFDRSAGLLEGPVGVGVDTGQNLWVVSREALYVMRRGAAAFERHRRASAGLRDCPLLSVAGGGPGVGYVGYEGTYGPDPLLDPEPVRKSGDVQRLELVAGGLVVHDWDLHNSNTPTSGKYDHSRSIFELVSPRRGPAAGELYVGTEHGLVRVQAEGVYADHRHVAAVVDGSQRFGKTGALAVSDEGTCFYGGAFAFGGLAYTPRLYEWYFEAPWLAPGQAFGPDDDRDDYEGAGFAPGGDVWVAGRGQGLARVALGRRRRIDTFPLPDPMVSDLAVDADGTLWIAADSGLYRGTPDGAAWTRVPGVEGPVRDLFLDDTVEPRTLWVAARAAVVAWRGP